jgi:hypothetical protein
LRRLARKTWNHPHFGPACVCLQRTLASVGWFSMIAYPERNRRDAYTPSLAFTIATCSAGLSCLAQHLPPFLPASDACPEPVEGIEDQSHARGRCCHSCTERIGVDVSHKACYHRTYMDTQLSKIVRPLLPVPRIAPVRANGSHQADGPVQRASSQAAAPLAGCPPPHWPKCLRLCAWPLRLTTGLCRGADAQIRLMANFADLGPLGHGIYKRM